MKGANQQLNGRYIIGAEEQPLNPVPGRFRLEGLFLLTEDGLGTARALADSLIYQGAFAYIIEEKDCLDEATIAAEVALARSLFGPVNGIIHLAGLRAAPMPEDIDSWHYEVKLQCKSFFHLLRHTYEDLQRTGPLKKLLACSLLGGYYGRDLCAQPGLPVGGGGQGLLRSIEYEWDNILAKTIDFDLSLDAASMAMIILQELNLGGGQLEIGYPQGRRTVFSTITSPIKPSLKPTGLLPKKNWVILATGGARGITAETIQMLSNEDNHFILVGRSALLERSEHQQLLSLDERALRARFIEEARISTVAVLPRQIEARIARILNDREMRRRIAQLRRIGSKVTYLSCDVSDPVAFGNLIDNIYKTLGRIDVVIHGAGVIDDYLLADKTAASLDKVFDTKVDSAWTLYRHLHWQELKGFVLFSSTAGRYGNRGQSDYAAANEVLNRLAWRMRAEWPHVLVKSLNWGPWSGVGMASGAVNDQFLSRGIIPISAESGTRHFTGELLHGPGNEVEVVLGEGTWDPARPNKLKDLFDIDVSALRFFN